MIPRYYLLTCCVCRNFTFKNALNDADKNPHHCTVHPLFDYDDRLEWVQVVIRRDEGRRRKKLIGS